MGCAVYGAQVMRAVISRPLWVAPVVIAAWILMAVLPMGHAFPAFVPGWTVMVIAMMVPTVMRPMRRLAQGSSGRAAEFLAGYVIVWALMSVPAFVLMAVSMGHAWLLGVGAVLVGAYQLLPSTWQSLHRCHSLATDAPALGAGMRQGLWCARACGPLMVITMAAAMSLPVVTGLVLMAAVTAFMIWEKSPRFSEPALRWSSLGLVAVGVLLALSGGGHTH